MIFSSNFDLLSTVTLFLHNEHQTMIILDHKNYWKTEFNSSFVKTFAKSEHCVNFGKMLCCSSLIEYNKDFKMLLVNITHVIEHINYVKWLWKTLQKQWVMYRAGVNSLKYAQR